MEKLSRDNPRELEELVNALSEEIRVGTKL